MILIKEEFIGGEKYRRAVKLGGSDAIAMWLALKCYCSQHPDTEGFVPAEELDELPGAPRRASKALQALIDCGRLLPRGARGAGLIEVAEGGWKMHDYADHAPAPEETELRREKARLRQQAHREAKRRELAAVKRFKLDIALLDGEGVTGNVTPGKSDNPCDMSRDNPRDIDGTSLAGAPPHEGAREPAPTRAGALPNPTLPNPTKKTLLSLTSTIRDARAIEASPEQRLFADENGVDLESVLAELRAAPDTAGLSLDEIRVRLDAKLAQAVEQREPMGGAA
jgi:hypothetical protein